MYAVREVLSMIFRPPWGIASMLIVAVSIAVWDSVTPSERRTRTILNVCTSSATRSWTVIVEPSRMTDRVSASISTLGWMMYHTKATAATISTTIYGAEMPDSNCLMKQITIYHNYVFSITE